MSTWQGRTELPERQSAALRRAVRLEWITIGFLAVTVTAVFLVMGNSQAMRAAWIEDMLSFIPPLAFLLAVRLVARPPNTNYPYGYHHQLPVRLSPLDRRRPPGCGSGPHHHGVLPDL